MAQPVLDLDPMVERSEAPRDDLVVLEGVSWADYQRLLEIRGDRSRPRFTYCEGRLELMSPSHRHDFIKSALGRLVEAWCLARGVDFTAVGSWTLESKAAERGVEPDECYCLGENAARTDPERPDLAIEVIYTSGSISKLDVYRKLGVPEVWLWRRGAVSVHALVQGEERYEAVAKSLLLPDLDLDELLRFTEIRPMSQAVRAYQAALASRPR